MTAMQHSIQQVKVRVDRDECDGQDDRDRYPYLEP